MDFFSAIKSVHLLCVCYFLGFLLLDLFVLRRFLSVECSEKKILFYERAKYSLHLFVSVLMATGAAMLYLLDFNVPFLIWLKVALALSAITLFFVSPYLVKRLPKGSVHYIYTVVLAFALGAFFLGANA
jgi:hypothetical protein